MVETRITQSAELLEPANIELPKGSLLSRLPLFFLGVGLAALLYWASLYQLEPSRAMFAYIYAFAVLVSLGLGCLGFVLIQHLTRAGWSVALRRIPETAIALLPIFIIFFIPIALSMHDIFPWTHEDHIDDILAKKLPYLNQQFFLMRSFAYLLIWAVSGVIFYRLSLSQDRLFGLDPSSTGEANKSRVSITRVLQALSAPGIILFALSLTFAAFDWFMSLQPHWYSTIFGVYYFAGSFLFALAFITLLLMALQASGVLKNIITPEHYHDLGKLLFGFTIFWSYISFSQFMLYWYGNIPEEIEFYTHRMHNGWDIVSWAIPIGHFLIPFLALMSRFLKRVKLVLAINCLWIIGVHLMDLYWLIIPTYPDHSIHEGPTKFNILLVDILALLGLLSIFFGLFLLVLSRQKILALGDPRLKESLAFENI